MFQINPNMIELIQTFSEKNKNLTIGTGGKILTMILPLLLTIAIAIIYKHFKSEKKYPLLPLAFLLIMLTIGLTTNLTFQILKNENTKENLARSITEKYNTNHNNKIIDTSGHWLIETYYSDINYKEKLLKITNYPKLDEKQYIQATPAPAGDAPVVKTRIVTKSDAQKQKEYQNILPTEDVQLIKIETIDNQTMVTAHIKINGESHTVEISENVLDKMLQSKTNFYYDKEKEQLVVGV